MQRKAMPRHLCERLPICLPCPLTQYNPHCFSDPARGASRFEEHVALTMPRLISPKPLSAVCRRRRRRMYGIRSTRLPSTPLWYHIDRHELYLAVKLVCTICAGLPGSSDRMRPIYCSCATLPPAANERGHIQYDIVIMRMSTSGIKINVVVDIDALRRQIA